MMGERIKKALISIFFMVILISNCFTYDFSTVDDLYNQANFQEGLKILQNEFSPTDPDPAMIWRMSRFAYEIADKIPKRQKEEKIEKFTEAMKIAEPYLNIKTGKNADRAELIFWYAANYGARGEVVGIKESLGIIPDLFELANKSLAMDPTLASSYLLKGRIDAAVPFLLGGDKFRMGTNLSKAVKYGPDNLSILVDSANAFMKRNWDIDKKKQQAEKKGMTDGTPNNISDKEYAKQLLKQAVQVYKNLKQPNFNDKIEYERALKLLNK